MIPVSTFIIETGPDWALRRGMFKHSFSMISLQKLQHLVHSLSEKLSKKLMEQIKASSDKAPIIEMDVLFGQLTMDVICSVAFGFEMNALDNSQLFQVDI